MKLPRGCGSSMVMIAVMCTSQKNMAPESFPRPDPIGARRTSGRAAIVDYIVTAVAGVKLPLLCRLRNQTRRVDRCDGVVGRSNWRQCYGQATLLNTP